VLGRLAAWSLAAGVLWLAGALVSASLRFALWDPALAIELAGPIAGYWTPGRGTSSTMDYPVDGGCSAKSCFACA
jgi:low temperature requirement protein LtrA